MKKRILTIIELVIISCIVTPMHAMEAQFHTASRKSKSAMDFTAAACESLSPEEKNIQALKMLQRGFETKGIDLPLAREYARWVMEESGSPKIKLGAQELLGEIYYFNQKFKKSQKTIEAVIRNENAPFSVNVRGRLFLGLIAYWSREYLQAKSYFEDVDRLSAQIEINSSLPLWDIIMMAPNQDVRMMALKKLGEIYYHGYTGSRNLSLAKTLFDRILHGSNNIDLKSDAQKFLRCIKRRRKSPRLAQKKHGRPR
jgi:hypothetical protein